MAGTPGFSGPDDVALEIGPLHDPCGPDTTWTTNNMAEAIPGVPTPLTWSLWAATLEAGVRLGSYRMGALSRRELGIPAQVDDRFIAIFAGRASASVDFSRMLADNIPGTSGDDVEIQFFGKTREGTVNAPNRWRYPIVATKTSLLLAGLPRRARTLLEDNRQRWQQVLRDGTATSDPRRLLLATRDRLISVFATHSHTTNVASAVQAQLIKACAAAGVPGLEDTIGGGALEEQHLVADLWELSRRRLDETAFLDRHGYHGPAEAELSAPSWRVEPAPVRYLAELYAQQPDGDSPDAATARRAKDRQQGVETLLAATPASRRAPTRLLLTMASRLIPLREVTKSAFVMCFDVAREAATVLGGELTAAGVLTATDDVHYLTLHELTQQMPAHAADAAAGRRAQREQFLSVEPTVAMWKGPVSVQRRTAAPPVVEINGVAAAPGVVEGVARVVSDPAADRFEPGEILVCETTDPSWAAAMYLAAALVIDIGSQMSHGAIIARELGVPCVIGTAIGTTAISTGDTIRVDGGAGRVRVLARAAVSRLP